MIRRNSLVLLAIGCIVLALVSGPHSVAESNRGSSTATADADPSGGTPTAPSAQPAPRDVAPSESESSDYPHSGPDQIGPIYMDVTEPESAAPSDGEPGIGSVALDPGDVTISLGELFPAEEIALEERILISDIKRSELISRAQDPTFEASKGVMKEGEATTRALTITVTCPSVPSAGQAFTVNVDISNGFNWWTGSFGLCLYIDGVFQNWCTEIPSIWPFGSYELTVNFTVGLSCGNHTIGFEKLGTGEYGSCSEYWQGQGDIRVEVISCPSNPSAGQSFTPTIEVWNIGNCEIGYFSVRMDVDNVIMGYLDFNFNFPPNNYATVDWTINGIGCGYHCVGFQAQVPDANGSNNYDQCCATFQGSPNISVSMQSCPSSVTAGQAFTVTARFTNSGNCDSVSFQASLEVDGQSVGTVQVPALGPGWYFDVNGDFGSGLSCGYHSIVFRAGSPYSGSATCSVNSGCPGATPVCCEGSDSCVAECCDDSDCPDQECRNGVCNNGTCGFSNKPSGTPCSGAPSGACDEQDTCNGFGSCVPKYKPSSYVCRPDLGECDRPEYCLGNSPTCPVDQCETNGSPCTDDGFWCNGPETCFNCTCVSGPAPCPQCCDDGTDTCTSGPSCTSPGECEDGNPCTTYDCVEECCVYTPLCSTDASCDDGLFCNGAETCVDGCCQSGTDPCAPSECCEYTDQCGICPVCDNGVCEAGEDCDNCPQDCGGPCPCTPDFSVTAPMVQSSTTCGAADDCALRATEEHIYEVTIPDGGEWVFSLCGSTYDTYLYLSAACCEDEVTSNDDTCNVGSEITVALNPGTYFLTVEGWDGCGDYMLDIRKALCPNGVCDLGEYRCTCPQDCGPCCGDGVCEAGETSCYCLADCPLAAARGVAERPAVSTISETLVPIPEGTAVRALTIPLGSEPAEGSARLERFIQYQNVDPSGFYADTNGGRVADDIHEDPTLPPSIITDITFGYCVQGSNPSGTWPAVISILAGDPADTTCAPPICSYTVDVPDNTGGPYDLACYAITLHLQGPEQRCEKPGPDYWIEVDYAGTPIIDLGDGLGPIPHGGPRFANFPTVGSSDDLILSDDPGDCSQVFFYGGCPPAGQLCANFYHEVSGFESGDGPCDTPDLDGDGVCDACDNCPNDPNPFQEDANGDGIGDACDAQCGNGIVETGEACDDGNTVDCDGCRGDCSGVEGTCGDGTLDPVCEVCDEGSGAGQNGSGEGHCLTDCTRIQNCGDGTKDDAPEGTEVCDDGAANGTGPGLCNEFCTRIQTCGDGFRDGTEVCDDSAANGTGEGFCLTDCTRIQNCGDGIKDDAPEGTEFCDDGAANGTGPGLCNEFCTRIQSCGDSFVDGTEVCDEGAGNGTGEGHCLADCSGIQMCGDGDVEGTEVCDEGIALNGSGNNHCVADCSDTQVCGDSTVHAQPIGTEACDDGNTADCDGCRGDCSAAEGTCGDGALDTVCETCDDGNIDDGDGCLSTCTVETGCVCTGEPSVCVCVPIVASYPHDRRKNRYISFDPNKAGNDGLSVAFKVELKSISLGSCSGAAGSPAEVDFCRTDRVPPTLDCNTCAGAPAENSCINQPIDCGTNGTCTPTGETCVNDAPNSGGSNVGTVWWVGPEQNGVHLLVSQSFRKESTNWANPVHVGDCEVVPEAVYGVRAVNVESNVESDELLIETALFASLSASWWGDCVGPLKKFCGGDIRTPVCIDDGDCTPPETCDRAWTLPDGSVNFDDVNAALALVAPSPTTVPPDITWVDLHGNATGTSGSQNFDPPNYGCNFSDIGQILSGFGGFPYKGYDPADCPDSGTWP